MATRTEKEKMDENSFPILDDLTEVDDANIKVLRLFYCS